MTDRPSFAQSMGVFWLYTGLRFAMFLVLWGLLVLFGVGGFIGAIIALALSIPLSFVLLAKPRAMFSANIERRIGARVQNRWELDKQLDPNQLDPDADEPPAGGQPPALT